MAAHSTGSGDVTLRSTHYHVACLPRISKPLLPIKLFYFFYCGGMASLMPFLPVYLIQVTRLTPLHLAIIFGSAPFITLFAKPIFGIIADKMKKIKLLLPLCIMTLTFSFVCVLFTPPLYPARGATDVRVPDNSTSGAITLYCDRHTALFITECSRADQCLQSLFDDHQPAASVISCHILNLEPAISSDNSTSQQPRSSNHTSRLCPPELTQDGDTDYTVPTHISCGNHSLQPPYHVYLLRNGEKSHENTTDNTESTSVTLTPVPSLQEKPRESSTSVINADSKSGYIEDKHEERKDEQSVNTNVTLLDDDEHQPSDVGACSYYNVISGNSSSSSAAALHVEDCGGYEEGVPVLYSVDMACAVPAADDSSGPGDSTRHCYGTSAHLHTPHRATPHEHNQFGMTFWCIYLLVLVARLCIGVIYALADALTLDMLAERPRDFGKQRLWGTIGWGICSLLSGVAMQQAGGGEGRHFEAAFYIFASIMFIGFLVSLFLTPVHGLETPNLAAGFRFLCQQVQLLVFIISVFLFGMIFAVYITFYILYLDSMGAPALLQGLVLLVDAVAEVPLFFISGVLIKRLGYAGSTSVGFACWAVRLLSLSYLTNPWWCLPLEALHGFCFGLMYSTMVLYGKVHTPAGMSATVQSLIGATFDVGIGGGALVCGVMFDAVGGRHTFRWVSWCALAVAALYCPLQTVLARYGRPTPPPTTDPADTTHTALPTGDKGPPAHDGATDGMMMTPLQTFDHKPDDDKTEMMNLCENDATGKEWPNTIGQVLRSDQP